MREAGHIIMLLRKQDIYTHTHTPFTRECSLSFQAGPPLYEQAPLCGQATPLWTGHSTVDRPALCGQTPVCGQARPLWTGHSTVDRPPFRGQACPLWTGHSTVDRPPLCGQARPLWTGPPPGVLNTHLCSCGTCPCVLAAEGPPGSG